MKETSFVDTIMSLLGPRGPLGVQWGLWVLLAIAILLFVCIVFAFVRDRAMRYTSDCELHDFPEKLGDFGGRQAVLLMLKAIKCRSGSYVFRMEPDMKPMLVGVFDPRAVSAYVNHAMYKNAWVFTWSSEGQGHAWIYQCQPKEELAGEEPGNEGESGADDSS